jgi:hypothetical protein
MNEQATPSTELRDVLIEYEGIQREEKTLSERKAALKEKLAKHMQSQNAAEWMPEIDGRLFKVRYRHATTVEYDEETLHQRLGDRYRLVLGPDPRKVRRHLDEIAPLLEPCLDIIGSPVPHKVKEAITAGVVKADEFRGAFKKTEKDYITVSQPAPPMTEPSL